MNNQSLREQNPAVSIGHLSITQAPSRYPDPWVCLFPKEVEELKLSRPLLALWGEINTVAGHFSDRGVLIFKTSDLELYAYAHKLSLLNSLVRRGVVKRAGLGYWAINPRLLWSGTLKSRARAIEHWESLGEADYRGGW